MAPSLEMSSSSMTSPGPLAPAPLPAPEIRDWRPANAQNGAHHGPNHNTAMNYVFGRLQCQLIRSSASRRLPTCCRPQTQFRLSHRQFRSGVVARQSSRAASIPEPDETEPEAKAKRLDQKELDEQEQQVRIRQKQVQRPWHRQGADDPPVEKHGNETSPVTKGGC